MRKRVFFPQSGNDYFGRDFLSTFFSDGADYSVPAVNIRENDDSFKIELAAPGLNKEDIKVSLDKDVLKISSESESKKESDDKNFRRKEFGYTSFCRSFSIPENVDTEAIKASMTNGILSVELPKLAEEKQKLHRMIKIS